MRTQAFLVALLLAAPAAAEDMSLTPAQQLVKSDRVLLIAHRGASGVAPENTLPAFRRALEIGVDLVELDYYHTADGVPVVFHDKDLKRTTNAQEVLGDGKLPIGRLTREQTRRLDVGAWFAPEFRGTPLPTLEESLALIQSRGMTLVERKEGDGQTCVELLANSGYLERVVVQAFDWEFLADCRRRSPTVALGALGDKEITADKLAELERLDVQAVGWNHKFLTASEIAALHRRGLKVWAYTVNEPARAKELIAAGIDGLITDVPQDLKPLLAQP